MPRSSAVAHFQRDEVIRRSRFADGLRASQIVAHALPTTATSTSVFASVSAAPSGSQSPGCDRVDVEEHVVGLNWRCSQSHSPPALALASSRPVADEDLSRPARC
jgi:hypothetical protein